MTKTNSRIPCNKDAKKEGRIREWIKANHGVLSSIARSFDPPYTPQYVQRVAYNRNDVPSKGLRIEHALLERGCPLIQKIT